MIKKKLSSNKSFGIVIFLILLAISVFPLFNGGVLIVWSFLISIIFLTLGVMNSKILTPLNKIWLKTGQLLGKIVSPIVMGIIYSLIITPTSFLLKIFGKDLLNIKKNNNKTYWIKKDNKDNNMKDQF